MDQNKSGQEGLGRQPNGETVKTTIAQTKNLVQISEAAEALASRTPGLPGIGLVWGMTGAGKTTAACWLRDRVNAIFVRAYATWTPSAMLGAICLEAGLPRRGSCAAMVEAIVGRLVETLRDIHDVSFQPLILIGMADFHRRVSQR
jgi:hypothetical protein